MTTQKYRIVRTFSGPERHLVTYRDGKPVTSEKVSDAAVLKDWKRYLRDTVGGSISVDQIGE
jgi:hypothetical protein